MGFVVVVAVVAFWGGGCLDGWWCIGRVPIQHIKT